MSMHREEIIGSLSSLLLHHLPQLIAILSSLRRHSAASHRDLHAVSEPNRSSIHLLSPVTDSAIPIQWVFRHTRPKFYRALTQSNAQLLGKCENENRRSENASISELGCLKRLTALSAFFPNYDLPGANDFFGKLNGFDISVEWIEYENSDIVSMKALTLGGVSITNKFNGLICKADLLWFEGVNGLSGAIHGTSHGFPYLKQLVISGCPDLNYVFTEPCARALPELRILKVEKCESLVSIVEGIEEEILEQDQGGDIIYFCRLEWLHLKDLPNLVGFHSGVKNRTSAVADGATYIRVQIVYPALKGCNFWAIHGFPCLKKLVIEGCPDLNYVFTEPCARPLPELRTLIVEKCESLVSIVGGIEERILEQGQGGAIIYFGRLEWLRLAGLPNLVGFHSWVKNRTSGAADGATYMPGKIIYPALKRCTFWDMPKATEVIKSRILPQLTGQDSKEICRQENDFHVLYS